MKPDATNDALFICPVCQAALTRVDKTFVCENRHCFDIAKEGYVNLLPVQKKKSISPGDNNVMIKSRKDFLDKHYYDMLIAPCANIINQLIAERFEHCMLLDVGCGNGFFTRHIYNQLAHDVCCYGMDISKTAVRSSAKSERLIHWFVASSNDIPLQNNCIDIMLKINAPLNYQKSREKLSDNGLVISVTPGESHLNGLKSLIYKHVQNHEPEPCPKDYTLLTSKKLQQELQLNDETDIKNLFMMTPFFWHASQNSKDKIDQLHNLSSEIAFDINVWEKQ